MKPAAAVARLAALAQPSRLSVFRLLVEAGVGGMCVGDIASRLDVAAPTLSFHLKELAHAGLIKPRQDGRFIYYSADFGAMNELVAYLTDNCCGGEPCDIEARPLRKSARRAA